MLLQLEKFYTHIFVCRHRKPLNLIRYQNIVVAKINCVPVQTNVYQQKFYIFQSFGNGVRLRVCAHSHLYEYVWVHMLLFNVRNIIALS